MNKEQRKNLIILGSAALLAIIGKELAEDFINNSDSDNFEDDLFGEDESCSNSYLLNEYDSIDVSGIVIDDIENEDIENEDIENEDIESNHESKKTYHTTFKRTPAEVNNDINYHSRKLQNAKDDVKYYSDQLKRPNLSDVYIKNCLFSLTQARQKVEEHTVKIAKLIKELKNTSK